MYGPLSKSGRRVIGERGARLVRPASDGVDAGARADPLVGRVIDAKGPCSAGPFGR